MSTFFSRPTRIAAATMGALLAALVTAGCHDDNPPAATVVTTPPPAPAVVAPSGPATTTPGGMTTTTPDTKINTNAGPGTSNGTDSATAGSINKAIVQNKQMTGARVEAVVTAGIATLNGSVQNQQQKALAAKTASQVPGVSSVKNKLIIVTTGGAKPKPMVVTKTKTIVVHDKAAPTDGGTGDTSAPPPAAPDAPAAPAPPAAPDNGTGAGNGTSNP